MIDDTHLVLTDNVGFDYHHKLVYQLSLHRLVTELLVCD